MSFVGYKSSFYYKAFYEYKIIINCIFNHLEWIGILNLSTGKKWLLSKSLPTIISCWKIRLKESNKSRVIYIYTEDELNKDKGRCGCMKQLWRETKFRQNSIGSLAFKLLNYCVHAIVLYYFLEYYYMNLQCIYVYIYI